VVYLSGSKQVELLGVKEKGIIDTESGFNFHAIVKT